MRNLECRVDALERENDRLRARLGNAEQFLLDRGCVVDHPAALPLARTEEGSLAVDNPAVR